MSARPRKKKTKKDEETSNASHGNAGLPAADTLHLEYFKMLAAWRADYDESMEILVGYVDDAYSDLQIPINGLTHLDQIQIRIALALEYINLDADELDECGGETRSYKFGLTCVVDLVLKIICGDKGEGKHPLEDLPGDPLTKLLQIQSCMIALIARGEVSLACKLGRKAAVLFLIHDNLDVSGLLKKGFEKRFNHQKDRIKLLTVLAIHLKDNELPTQKALRISAFGQNKEPGNFSRLLKGMEVAKYIPREPTAGNNAKFGTIHRIKPSKDYDAAWAKFIDFMTTRSDGQWSPVTLIDADPDTAPYRSIIPSGDSELPSCEIRRIRESLGSVYWLLLLQFGMSEPENDDDLKAFMRNLAAIGLKLV